MNYKAHFKSWYPFIMDYKLDRIIESKILPTLRKEYEVNSVFPIKRNIFRAFRLCEFDKTNVLLLGLDPYTNTYRGQPSACGLCFATENGYTNPSAKFISKELEIEGFGARSPREFMNWSSQGVLMLNAALTVLEKSTKSHYKLWSEWTEAFFVSLSKEKPMLVYLMLGKDAQSYQQYSINGHFVKAPHPAAEAYSGGNSGFLNSNCFTQVNDLLIKYNKPLITW